MSLMQTTLLNFFPQHGRYYLQLMLTTIHDSVDEAMEKAFELYPTSYFSSWHETSSECWMDVVNSGRIVGKIVEIE